MLAVPKTGTTALEGALAPRASMVLRDPPELKHAPVYRYGRFLAPLFEKVGGELETLAVVREPVDWLSSWYRYRLRDALAGEANSTRGLSFDAFVEDYCRGRPPPHAQVGSQAKFLLDGEGRLGVDHLFRYDDQAGLLAFLEARLQTPIAPRRVNVSPDGHTALSDRVRDKLRRKRPDEFRVYAMARQAAG